MWEWWQDGIQAYIKMNKHRTEERWQIFKLHTGWTGQEKNGYERSIGWDRNKLPHMFYSRTRIHIISECKIYKKERKRKVEILIHKNMFVKLWANMALYSYKLWGTILKMNKEERECLDIIIKRLYR